MDRLDRRTPWQKFEKEDLTDRKTRMKMNEVNETDERDESRYLQTVARMMKDNLESA